MSDESSYQRWNGPRGLKMKLHVRAAELRHEGTQSEDVLWQALRNRKLKGRKFRRQVPIGAFILDFHCAEEKLAIEVDGSIHERQGKVDQLRQETLRLASDFCVFP